MNAKNHAVSLWLCICLLLVAGMVLVGGYTRLSGSGLSITQWKPVHGIIPPLSETTWEEEFEHYQASPQYQKVNLGMTLEEFKVIFWPEYWHRVLGRAVGFVFFLPLFYFAIRKTISPRFALRLFVIFALGGLQGLVGWIMVKSGLVDDPYVSHLKLALHLAIAFIIFALILWALLDSLSSPRKRVSYPRMSGNWVRLADRAIMTYKWWFALLCLQIVFGAFVAGLHAGLIYNTYPTMNGAWLPPELWADSSIWHSPVWMQFIHRSLAVIVALGFIIWWYLQRAYVNNNHLGKVALGVALIIALQFTLGVATLLHQVPMSLALAHQMTALALFGLSIILLYQLMKTQ
jgi:cytochrome c oxidase assembly protein subunit 15